MNWRFVFFTLAGRIGRKTFWLATLMLVILYMLPIVWLLIRHEAAFLPSPSALWVRQLSAVIDLVLAWPFFAVAAKRQQDRGQWPWLAWAGLVLSLVYVMLDLTGRFETVDGLTWAGIIWLGSGAILFFYTVVELGMMPGTRGPNRYGADPLQPA